MHIFTGTTFRSSQGCIFYHFFVLQNYFHLRRIERKTRWRQVDHTPGETNSDWVSFSFSFPPFFVKYIFACLHFTSNVDEFSPQIEHWSGTKFTNEKWANRVNYSRLFLRFFCSETVPHFLCAIVLKNNIVFAQLIAMLTEGARSCLSFSCFFLSILGQSFELSVHHHQNRHRKNCFQTQLRQ